MAARRACWQEHAEVILEAKPFYLGTALKRANRAFARGMCMPQTMGTVKEAAAKGDEAKMGRQS